MQREKNSVSLTGQGGFEPFRNLDRYIAKSSLPVNCKPAAYRRVASYVPASECSDSELFEAAMADVTRLAQTTVPEGPQAQREARQLPTNAIDEEGRRALDALVRHGIGFRVSHTPEYIQGSGLPVDPALLKKLRQGKFAIEAHIDLHGFTADEAAERLNRFIEAALKSGKRSVLLVHGRGLSSPGKPVLKALVERVLTQGPYRRWLLAYTSARQCDGGAGATQVLFRRRPLTAKQVKQTILAGHHPVDVPV
jgi:DNA-nicking Smr family endonuclease